MICNLRLRKERNETNVSQTNLPRANDNISITWHINIWQKYLARAIKTATKLCISYGDKLISNIFQCFCVVASFNFKERIWAMFHFSCTILYRNSLCMISIILISLITFLRMLTHIMMWINENKSNDKLLKINLYTTIIKW